MKTKLFLLAVLSFILTTSCLDNEPDGERVVMTVASEKRIGVDIITFQEREYLYVKEGKDTEWRLLYEGIEGFEHTKGFEYTVKVKKRQYKNLGQAEACFPPNVIFYHYSLVKVLSKKEVNATVEKTKEPL